MEAVLDFGQGRQKWLKFGHGEYVGGGGELKWSAGQLAVITFGEGSEGGGEEVCP
jgi:hypothetical protein